MNGGDSGRGVGGSEVGFLDLWAVLCVGGLRSRGQMLPTWDSCFQYPSFDGAKQSLPCIYIYIYIHRYPSLLSPVERLGIHCYSFSFHLLFH